MPPRLRRASLPVDLKSRMPQLRQMGPEPDGSEAFGVRRQRPLAGTGTHLVRRIKGDPSKAASKATQYSVWGAMHFLVAVGYLVFVHPAHHALLVRWLPGMAYLILALSYLGIAWRARGTRTSSRRCIGGARARHQKPE